VRHTNCKTSRFAGSRDLSATTHTTRLLLLAPALSILFIRFSDIRPVRDSLRSLNLLGRARALRYPAECPALTNMLTAFDYPWTESASFRLEWRKRMKNGRQVGPKPNMRNPLPPYELMDFFSSFNFFALLLRRDSGARGNVERLSPFFVGDFLMCRKETGICFNNE